MTNESNGSMNKIYHTILQTEQVAQQWLPVDYYIFHGPLPISIQPTKFKERKKKSTEITEWYSPPLTEL